MGLVSSTVGHAIDRHGGRAVMTLGTVFVSAGLFALAHVHGQAAYLAVWAFLGLGMRLCLYDAAFAALVQVAPSRGRMAISYLTLVGAFASSVFWVVGRGTSAGERPTSSGRAGHGLDPLGATHEGLLPRLPGVAVSPGRARVQGGGTASLG
jgi:MFS family permease